MRKTKIVCTIGPACDTPELLRELCLAGMNVARTNFSHGVHADHKRRIDALKAVREELGLPIAIMLDTKGPEYRIGTFAEGRVQLVEGDPFIFTTEAVVGDRGTVSVSYPDLPRELGEGGTVLLNNGLLSFAVERIEGGGASTPVWCTAESSPTARA